MKTHGKRRQAERLEFHNPGMLACMYVYITNYFNIQIHNYNYLAQTFLGNNRGGTSYSAVTVCVKVVCISHTSSISKF